MGFGWLFSSLLLFANAGLTEISDLSMMGWLSLSFLGIFCSGFAYIFWFDALNVIVAAIILAEPLLLASLIGGAIILLGVWLVNHSVGIQENSKNADPARNL
jgi:drug/metabolite transporter (DMT)-like permease